VHRTKKAIAEAEQLVEELGALRFFTTVDGNRGGPPTVNPAAA
jgi:hypothetical protein